VDEVATAPLGRFVPPDAHGRAALDPPITIGPPGIDSILSTVQIASS